MNTNFLWVDFQRHTLSSGLFEMIPPSYKAHKVKDPESINFYITKEQPSFLCFEFDRPSMEDLDILQNTKRRYPELPILMITEPNTEALAIWAFKSGVQDYLVKPCARECLDASIAAITQLRDQYGSNACRLPLFPPAPISKELLDRRPESPYQKTSAALKFVEKHYSEEIRLSDVAELCHLNASTFSRLFKKEHHINFSEHLMKKRIAKACELLDNTSIQIKAAAFSVGFNDLSYFTRTFKRFKGITPSQYQKNSDLK